MKCNKTGIMTPPSFLLKVIWHEVILDLLRTL